MTNDVVKLKSSLNDVIQAWAEEHCEDDGCNELNIDWGNETMELMTDAAFNILLAISDHNKYLKENGMLN